MHNARLARLLPSLALASLWMCFASHPHAAPCTSGTTLRPLVSLTTGTKPHGVAAADFNGDGRLDLVAANSYDGTQVHGTITVFLGIGGLVFGPGSQYTAFGHPYHALARDFDGDGRVDVVTANYGTNTISLLRGQGTGAFAPAVNYAAGTNPTFSVAEDFNADGRLDLAVLNLTEGKLSVLLGQPSPGNGVGVFSGPVTYTLGPVTSLPSTAYAADYDSDGILDLAVALYGQAQILILRGDGAGGSGNGQFLAPSVLSVGTHPWNVAAHDFNSDGIIDLALTDDAGLGIALGNGNGGLGDATFQAPVHYPAGGFPQGMACADFSGDGIADVTVGVQSRLAVFDGVGSGGQGTGAFANPQTLSTGATFALLAAEIDTAASFELCRVDYTTNTLVIYTNVCVPEPGPAGAAIGLWTPHGEPVCVEAGAQTGAVGVSDGAQGAFITWLDARSGSGHAVYATHLDGEGHLVSGWAPNGSPICDVAGDRSKPAIASDGAGGAFIGWLDTRDGGNGIYLQHVLSDGQLAAGWPTGGLRVTSTTTQLSLSMDSDGLGGVVMAASDTRHGSSKPAVFAFRMTGSGTYPTGWPSSGKQVTVYYDGIHYQEITVPPVITGDLQGSIFVVTGTNRSDGIDFDPGFARTEFDRVTNAGITGFSDNDRSQYVIAAPSAADGAGGWISAGAISTPSALMHFFRMNGNGAVTWNAYLPWRGDYLVDADGSGGAVVAVSDFDNRWILGYRLTANGVTAPGWNSTGNAVGAGATGIRKLFGIAKDLGGGAYFGWTDTRRDGLFDLYATHYKGDGTLASGWTPSGDVICGTGVSRSSWEMFSDSQGGAIVVWCEPRLGNQQENVYAQRIADGMPVATAMSLLDVAVSATSVRLTWHAPSAPGEWFVVQRRDANTGWAAAGTEGADDIGRIVHLDRSVHPGARYGFRIAPRNDPSSFSEATWVDVPYAPTLALTLPRNPVSGALNPTVVLPDGGSAVLEVLDVSGRVVVSTQVGAMGPGTHTIALTEARRLAPGVWFLRLTHGSESRTLKFVSMR